jgi:hypothetical protein
MEGETMGQAGLRILRREQMKRLFILPALAALLSGCAVAAKVNARHDMEASKVAYKACLAERGQDAAACEGLRQAYQADLSAYQATSAGPRSAPVYMPADPGPQPLPPNPMSIVVGPNGWAHPCMAMGPTMTVCN